MKILRDTFELAKAAAKESEVSLWLVGNKGVITDVVPSPRLGSPEIAATYIFNNRGLDRVTLGMTQGQFRYGKVITKNDRVLEDCLNLVEADGKWRFVDDFGDELPLEIVEEEGRIVAAEEKK